MNYVERVLGELQVGPSTARELADCMGGNARNISAVLHNLERQKRVCSRPFYRGARYQTNEVVRLYSLPEHSP